MKPLLVVPMPGQASLARGLARELGARGAEPRAAASADLGTLALRSFPDGESLLAIDPRCRGRHVLLACTLHRPDAKLMPLMLASHAARDLGARSVTLVAPYLAYLRQDARFHAGEAVSSRAFGAWLSAWFDAFVTVDPHLHRHRSLGEIATIPAVAVPAAGLIARWVRETTDRPVIVGPDAESRQWAEAVARSAGAPHVVLKKVRHGDHDVGVSASTLAACRGRTPVLVDDIVSTGGTLAAAVRLLRGARLPAPACVVVHGVFAPGAVKALRAAGAGAIVTTNTIPGRTAKLDVTPLLADAVAGLGLSARAAR